jgi:putative acyl-CoA dehydrogenase
VLRALHKEPETGEALFAELGAGLHPALDAQVASLREALHAPSEAGARLLVERMALALQAAVLLRANAAIAPLFCESRLAGAHGLAFGTLRVDDARFESILQRAL